MDASSLAAVLAWGALKGALLLTAAGLAVLALKGASAAVRHAVWSVALCAALVLPALDALGPAWRLAVLPPAPAMGSAVVAGAPAGAPWVAAALFGIWLFGAAVVSARWIAAAAAARRLVAGSRPLHDHTWHREAARISAAVGLDRQVELRESAAIRSPVTWGVRRSVLLLPAGAGEWTAERRVAVLTHELSHVRRRDCLTGLVAEAACAIHWFDPLAWLAYRRLHVERERACDDGVLLGGLRASHYASHLLSVARDAGAREPAVPRLVPALARRSEIEERIRAMLDGRPRSGPLSRAAVSALAAAALAAAGLVGAVEPVRRAAPPPAAVLMAALSEIPAAPAVPAVPGLPTPRVTPPAETAPPAPAPRAPRRRAAPPPAPPQPPPPPPAPAAPSFEFAVAVAPEPPAARILTWRAPSGPSPSDEPRRYVRAVRVVSPKGPQQFALVLPDLPASIWRERSDEVWAYVERVIAREVQVRIQAGERPAIGVRSDRFVVAVRRGAAGASVDTASLGRYRATRDEATARTKAGT